jgi:hypothetical protein
MEILKDENIIDRVNDVFERLQYPLDDISEYAYKVRD